MGAGMVITMVSPSQVKAYCYPNLESCLRKQNDRQLDQEMKRLIESVDRDERIRCTTSHFGFITHSSCR